MKIAPRTYLLASFSFYNSEGVNERRGHATLIGIFKEEYRHGHPLTVVLPGTQLRDFTHVEDIIECTDRCWIRSHRS